MIQRLISTVRNIMARKGSKVITHRKLRCARCKTTDVTVSGVQQMLKREGKKRLFARVTCVNGHEWWSRHPEALKLSREVDQARVENTGQPHLGT